jgi:sugar lactone lactonase YvrE
VTHADLNSISDKGWNELVVDDRGNAYINGAGFDLMAGEKFAPGVIALLTPDGPARKVAEGIAFPNGMAVAPENSTLIVAESYAKRLTALSRRTAACRTGMGGPEWRRPRRHLHGCGGSSLVRRCSQQAVRARARRWGSVADD